MSKALDEPFWFIWTIFENPANLLNIIREQWRSPFTGRSINHTTSSLFMIKNKEVRKKTLMQSQNIQTIFLNIVLHKRLILCKAWLVHAITYLLHTHSKLSSRLTVGWHETSHFLKLHHLLCLMFVKKLKGGLKRMLICQKRVW